MVDETVSSESAQSRRATAANYLLAGLKTNPRKTALLCGLTVVLVVLLIRTASRPDSASAKVVELAAPQDSAVIFRTPALQAPVLEPKRQGSAGTDNRTVPKDTSDTMPQRDIFAIDLSYFPRLSTDRLQSAHQAGRTDPKQLKISNLRQRVRQFRLQSTMTGAEPAAYIDGILLRKGHTYKGFQIRQINNRSVLLEKDGYVFNLHMSQK